MKSGRMKRILLSVIAFLFVGCSIAGGTVLLSNTYISDSNRGGDSSNDVRAQFTVRVNYKKYYGNSSSPRLSIGGSFDSNSLYEGGGTQKNTISGGNYLRVSVHSSYNHYISTFEGMISRSLYEDAVPGTQGWNWYEVRYIYSSTTYNFYIYRIYDIKFYDNEGNYVDSTRQQHGYSFELPSTIDEKKVAGYSTTQNGPIVYKPNEEYGPNEDSELFVVFAGPENNIIWESGGTLGELLPSAYWNYAGSVGYTESNLGSNSSYATGTQSKSATSSATVGLALEYYTPIPIRYGYSFEGWYSSDGVKVADNKGNLVADAGDYTDENGAWQMAEDVTLTARWTVKSYNITYDLGYGGEMADKTSSYNVNIDVSVDIPTRPGYTFNGWTVQMNLDRMYNGTINLQTGEQHFYSGWPNAVYYEYFYMINGVNYKAATSGGAVIWRLFNNDGTYNGSIDTLIVLGQNNYAFNWYHLGNDNAQTQVSFSMKTGFSTSEYRLVGDLVLIADWIANNPAYYDSEGGYWYVENGKLPQSKVGESLKATLEGQWSSLTDGSIYYMGVEELANSEFTSDGGMQSKVYNGEEYVKFNGEYYLVEPIRWRLVYSSSQQEGYAVENTSVLATMAEIVFLGSYSSTKIGVGAGYSAESVTMLLKNQVSTEFLVNESREVEIFGAPKDTTTVSGSVFVASSEELASFTTNKNNTTGSGVKAGKVSLSDFVKDYLRATGQGNYYFTRDLGDQLNTILCLNPVGDRSQAKAQQTLGVQFTIKVTEYACKEM